MTQGTFVKLNPTSAVSEEFRQKVAALGDVKAEVLAVTRLGVCTLLLPTGVVIEGYSHPLPGKAEQHYLDLHETHLEELGPPAEAQSRKSTTTKSEVETGNEGTFSPVTRDIGNTGDFSPCGSYVDD